MSTRQTSGLPAPLEGVRRRFVRWRSTHPARSRIPDRLWAVAVKMASEYGLHRTARTLAVEYYSLKRRVTQHSAATLGRCEPSPAAAFLELSPPLSVGTCDCTLELEDAAGAKMHVHLKAVAPPDLAAICRTFWNPGA